MELQLKIVIGCDLAARIVEAWLFGKYADGRHDLRLKMISDIENEIAFPNPTQSK